MSESEKSRPRRNISDEQFLRAVENPKNLTRLDVAQELGVPISYVASRYYNLSNNMKDENGNKVKIALRQLARLPRKNSVKKAKTPSEVIALLTKIRGTEPEVIAK